MVGRSFQGSPWLTGSDSLLGGRKTNGLDQQRRTLLHLRLWDTMIGQQTVQTIQGLGIQTSTKNPWPGSLLKGIQVSDKQGPTCGMQLEGFIFGSREHFPTQHAVDEPEGTDPTKSICGKLPMDDMDCESPGTDCGGDGLMQD